MKDWKIHPRSNFGRVNDKSWCQATAINPKIYSYPIARTIIVIIAEPTPSTDILMPHPFVPEIENFVDEHDIICSRVILILKLKAGLQLTCIVISRLRQRNACHKII